MNNTEDIVKQLMDAKYSYYNDTPIMSDKDYDELEDKLRELDSSNKFFSIVGSPTVVGNKRKHKIPMGSLSKVKIDEGGIDILIETFLRKYPCIVSYKLDGISVSIEYVDGVFQYALTRGDGITGEIIPNALEIGNIQETVPYKFTGSVRGEIIMLYANFNLVNSELEESGNDQFSNPRNAVSGIARKEETPYRRYLTVLYYDMEFIDEEDDLVLDTKYDKFVYLEDLLGVESVVPYFAYVYSEIYKFRGFCNYMDDTRKGLDYMIDGLVIEVNDLSKYNSLGVTDNKPKGSKALKFHAVAETTTMTDIVWQVGSTGALTPVAEFEPTLIDGSIVRRASLHNYDIFKKWDLAKGDEVSVQKNNDIIPQLKERIATYPGNVMFEVPTHCPECGSELELLKVTKTTNLTCTNPMCTAKVTAKVKKWATKSGMTSKGVGDAFFKVYTDNWMDREDRDEYDIIYDLYDLDVFDIMELSDRYKEKSATNIRKAIQSSYDIRLLDFFGGLNIQGCGSRTFKKIIEASDINTSESNCIPKFYSYCMMNDISKIDGIGDITANLIKKSLPLLHNTLVLLGSVVDIIPEETTSTDAKTFLFTGSFNTIDPDTGKGYKRKALEALVSSKGHTPASSVNKNLDYLVTSDPESTSSKMVKARKLGVIILGEDEFFQMM